MTVYIVQDVPGRNFVPAAKYGELVSLLPAKTNLMLTTGPEVARLKRKLIDFNDDDYLLLVGDPAAIGLCCAVAAAINGPIYGIEMGSTRDDLLSSIVRY